MPNIDIAHVTLEQVQDIINSNDGDENIRIASFSEIKSTSYSYTAFSRTYYISLSESDKRYLLLVSPLAVDDQALKSTTPPPPITLPALSALLSKILDNTAVPVPKPIAHDTSGGQGKWQFGWLLLLIPGSPPIDPSNSLASIRHKFSPKQLARIELRLGTHLRALHGITNDWFGVPTLEPPPMPSFDSMFAMTQPGEEGEGVAYGEEMIPFSWQDTFVMRLEELLECVCGEGARESGQPDSKADFDVDELRRSLSRAIGSFLFDDVEIPKLIWVTGNEEDVVVSLGDTTGSDGEVEADVAYILPTFERALWGDPLMEVWFMPPGPSEAINEGYFDGEEGGTLIVFPRQNTKRTWYTVYLALAVLAEENARRGRTTGEASRETVRWAKEALPKCVEFLKNAPCY